MPPDTPSSGAALGVMLVSGDYERAHYAFMVAVAAAAVGRRTVLFATNRGCHALAAEWKELAGAEGDAAVRARGVAGFDALRDAAGELEVRLFACGSGLLLAGLPAAALLPGVEVTGIPAFLSAVGGGQIVTL